jgi:hypothetical protein
MHLLPKSAVEIEMAFGPLRWTNLVAGALLGAWVAFIPGLFLINRLGEIYALGVPAIACACIGIYFANRHWHKCVARYAESFIRLDAQYLEIKGVVPDGVWHVRFHLNEVASVQIGERRLVGSLSPLVAAIDSTTLVIEMKNGAGARFPMVGLIYCEDGLLALFSGLESKLGG